MTQEKTPASPHARPSTLQVRAQATISFDDEATCERAQAAIAPESEGFLEIRTEGRLLHLVVPTQNPARVLATLDDTIACLQAALGSQDAIRNPENP